MERDETRLSHQRIPSPISIHALRMERDIIPQILVKSIPISIHALRMERDDEDQRENENQMISIHALRMERDDPRAVVGGPKMGFLSTRSAWSATSDSLLFLAYRP